jgi:hypothetical protein
LTQDEAITDEDLSDAQAIIGLQPTQEPALGNVK